jgi:hypothetical protein
MPLLELCKNHMIVEFPCLLYFALVINITIVVVVLFSPRALLLLNQIHVVLSLHNNLFVGLFLEDLGNCTSL